ncbi:3-methyladenine DNA glycosylase [Actinopolyspora erythraea]|uniref:3-methyladenine DNA glycosylase n=2 Tax=Actinopolyspora erythraea TaxID=414996 RepID=A0A099D9T7_9ACTN|nr:hypothetical protein [Actinopolyspora erythraea]ASU80987.1 3-methyladenine DNA glycosylase [Actinopolyspora erythraea]KGI82130.1 3-methyladenine DNA glycosylase [Actinopolyspora erythraea]
MPSEVLSERTWRAREQAHLERMRYWTLPHRERQQRGEKHPVMDFLFTYYTQRPSKLERWQPGFGVALEDGAKFLGRSGYTETPDGVTVAPEALTPRLLDTADFVHRLLSTTESRPAQLGCFGMHEWAMVYRLTQDELRHSEWPLRLGIQGTNEVVESMRIQCSHYDAFRFFSTAARPRNTLQPTQQDRVNLEQPGCLHNNMDVFKWCYKLDPLVPAELTADAFELAAEIRELDMRASPYDLSELGYSPVAIETAPGRAEYVREQRAFTERASALRQRLIETCRQLLEQRVG